MMSPFGGLSFITHVFICLLKEADSFVRRKIFGQKVVAASPAHPAGSSGVERFLSAVLIASVFFATAGLAAVLVKAGMENHPNTFDEAVAMKEKIETTEFASFDGLVGWRSALAKSENGF